MKILLLVRHAEAIQGTPAQHDHNRTLTRQGKKHARLTGSRLQRQDTLPDMIISSTALRAQETVTGILEASRSKIAVNYTRNLYLADTKTIAQQIASLPNEVNIAMLVGHNPGIGLFLNMTCRVYKPMPAGTLARIQFDISHWNELKEGSSGELNALWKP